MQTCRDLWARGLACEFHYDANPKIKKQIEYASTNGIPVVVIFGGIEFKKGIVKIKQMNKQEPNEIEVAIADLPIKLLTLFN